MKRIPLQLLTLEALVRHPNHGVTGEARYPVEARCHDEGMPVRYGVITEADTCREFVTLRLVEAGWGAAPHAIGEQRSSTNGRIIGAGWNVRRANQLGNPTYGRIRVATFGSLVDTANSRLLKLRTVLADRFGGSSTEELLNRVFSQLTQDRLGI
jgi:hypothetical protein